MKQLHQTASLALVASSTIVLSFLSTQYVFRHLGASRETDALYAGMTIPAFVFEILAYSLTYVTVPLLATEDETTCRRDVWTLLYGTGAVFSAFGLLLAATARFWIPWLVAGFDPLSKAMAVQLTRIQLVGMVLTSISTVLACYHYSRNRFVWPEVCSLLAMAASLAYVVIGLPRLGIRAAAWGLVFRAVVEVLLLGPGIGRIRRPNWRTIVARETVRRIRPLIVGTCFYRTEAALDRGLASLGPGGSVSLLTLARQIQDAVIRMLNKAIANPIIPGLARSAELQDQPGFVQVYRKRLFLMIGVTVVLFLGLAAVGRPLLAAIFGSSSMGPREIHLLWWLMLAMFGVQLGYGSKSILAGSFFAMGDTTTPTRVGIACYCLGIVFKITGYRCVGLIGLAAGSSAYYLLEALVLQVLLNRTMVRRCAEPQVVSLRS